MAAQKKKSLGRGLGALIGSSDSIPQLDPVSLNNTPEKLSDGTQLVMINPRTIHNNPKQPRRFFDEEHLQELASSIRRDGVLEPIVVRKRADGEYELVSGERRVRASVLAELKEIPGVCRTVNDEDMLRLGIIENVQREDLNPIELAQAYRQLIAELGCTQDELTDVVGKKRATITNAMRLLHLPEDIQRSYMKASFFLGGGKTGMARRLSWDEPSLTLTCNPAQKQTERCHPSETRPLNVREYARIQSFPDEWDFQGSVSQQYKQIGNAVPVNLAYHVGIGIQAMLDGVVPEGYEEAKPEEKVLATIFD